MQTCRAGRERVRERERGIEEFARFTGVRVCVSVCASQSYTAMRSNAHNSYLFIASVHNQVKDKQAQLHSITCLPSTSLSFPFSLSLSTGHLKIS